MKEAGGETLELDRGRTRRPTMLQHEKPDDEETINFNSCAPRERIQAGKMLSVARGAASPWFTGRAQKPVGGEVSLTTGKKLADQGQT